MRMRMRMGEARDLHEQSIGILRNPILGASMEYGECLIQRYRIGRLQGQRRWGWENLVGVFMMTWVSDTHILALFNHIVFFFFFFLSKPSPAHACTQYI